MMATIQFQTRDSICRGKHKVPLEAVEARRLYRQVADQLRALIDSGEYAVGSRLPTERELADQLRVSRPTVREALIALEVEGRVRIRVGSGIYVSEPAALTPILPAAAEIEGPFELLRAREFIEGDIAVLVRVVGELFDQRLNPYFAKLAHYFENPQSWNAALAEHRAIRDAIAAHDPDAARVTMREHLARSQARFAQNFGTEASSAPRVRARGG